MCRRSIVHEQKFYNETISKQKSTHLQVNWVYMKKNILVLLVSLISFYICYNYIDVPIATFFHNNIILLKFAELITKLGGGLAITFTLYLLLIYAVMQENLPLAKKMVYVLIIFLLVGLTNNIIKVIFARARPIELFENAVYGFNFFKFGHHFASFPSGHTMAITATLYSLAKIWPKYMMPLMISAALIAFSRVIVGAHYLSDVFIGYISSIYLVDLFEKHLKLNIKN